VLDKLDEISTDETSELWLEIYLKRKRIGTMKAQMSLLKVMNIRWRRQIRI